MNKKDSRWLREGQSLMLIDSSCRYIYHSLWFRLTLIAPEVKIVELLNSMDTEEVAYNEWPHLDLH